MGISESFFLFLLETVSVTNSPCITAQPSIRYVTVTDTASHLPKRFNNHNLIYSRLARRGGVIRMKKEIYGEIRNVIKERLTEVRDHSGPFHSICQLSLYTNNGVFGGVRFFAMSCLFSSRRRPIDMIGR